MSDPISAARPAHGHVTDRRAPATKNADDARPEPDWQALRPLFDELDRDTRAAADAMRRRDMDAWLEHAAAATFMHERIAIQLGWRDPR